MTITNCTNLGKNVLFTFFFRVFKRFCEIKDGCPAPKEMTYEQLKQMVVVYPELCKCPELKARKLSAEQKKELHPLLPPNLRPFDADDDGLWLLCCCQNLHMLRFDSICLTPFRRFVLPDPVALMRKRLCVRTQTSDVSIPVALLRLPPIQGFKCPSRYYIRSEAIIALGNWTIDGNKTTPTQKATSRREQQTIRRPAIPRLTTRVDSMQPASDGGQFSSAA